MKTPSFLAAAAALLYGCGSAATIPSPPSPQVPAASRASPSPPASGDAPVPQAAPAVPGPAPAPADHGRRPLIGEAIARAEWARAENRFSCAPLALAGDGGQSGRGRRAEFSGGWAVAFDLPGLRSAYGFAGPGLIAADEAGPAEQRRRLAAQWPLFRDLAGLPQPAFAGYGLVGAEPYPETNPDGSGLHSLAYVRIGGQACTYNVWSRISRTHLERLLDDLRLLR